MIDFRPNVVSFTYANLEERFFAALVDTITLFAVSIFLIFTSVGTFLLYLLRFPLVFSFMVLTWTIWLLYFTLFEGLTGQTLGKRAVGIKVVNAETGQLASFGKILIRNILRIVDMLPFFYLIGIISITTSKRLQRIGDRAAGTVVIK